MAKLKTPVDREALKADINRLKSENLNDEELDAIMAKYADALAELNAAEGNRFDALRGAKRVSFAEKLEKADEETKQKYEFLRNYILAYKVHERLSQTGNTFSIHRNKVAVITFSGKKLKINLFLKFEDYAESGLPIVKDEKKKFEGVEVGLKITSDLAYRRARKLIDDAMANAGVEKPEELPEEGTRVGGKFEVYPEAGFFKYRLRANNGQILIVSNAYKSRKGAHDGIDTLKKNMVVGTHRVVEDKNGFSRFQIFTENDSRLVVAGETYNSAAGANSALESALRFYTTDKIVDLDEIPAKERREWEVELPEPEKQEGGKILLVDEGEDGIKAQLIASNGEILFNTQAYSSKAALLEGLDNIKEKALAGNMTVAKDKQERFQFKILSDNGMVLVLGESYSAKDTAANTARIVRNYFVSELPIEEAAPAEEEQAE